VKANFKSWIFQIARNTIIDHHRTSKVTSDIDEAFNIRDKTDIESEFVTKEQINQVRKYLETLSSEQRDLIVMRLWDGLSYAEISEILGKSEPSLRVSFSRIINKMQKEIVIAIILLAATLIN
jgi:RNA polymerase sigma-70 factor (ECF subfamily)